MMAFYDLLIDDISNNGMLFSFSPYDSDTTSLSEDTESSATTSWIDNDSDLLGELSSASNAYTSSNEQTETTEFDLYYDSDL